MDRSSFEVLTFLFSKAPEIEASPTSDPRVPVVGMASNSEWLLTEFRSTINLLLMSWLLMLARSSVDVPLRNRSAASGVSESIRVTTSVELTTEARAKSPRVWRMEMEYPVRMDHGTTNMFELFAQWYYLKLWLLWGWEEYFGHYPSALWQIYQALLGLGYSSAISTFSFWPEMVICCPFEAVPGKLPRSLPPENISLPEVGISSEMRTKIFRVLCPLFARLLKISTLWTLTVVP